jgi:hypothetical protein
MVILDENSEPIILDNIDIPFPVSHFWILDLNIMDFTLKELVLCEELTTQTLSLTINGYLLEAPSDWNILVYSMETSMLDVVTLSDLTKHVYSAFVYNHKRNRLTDNSVRVEAYDSNVIIQTPSLVKDTMLCHPLGNDMWACIAPTDSYNKYIKGKVIGDIL